MKLLESRIFKKILMSSLFFGKYFKSLLNIIPISPIFANVKITENCNSRCITCNAWEIKYDNECSTLEFENIMKQIRQIGIEQIRFTGGEPLLREDIGDLIKKARHLGFKSIAIQTNGLLLSRKAEELVESGITTVSVSVDGIGETHDRIRGIPNGFDKSIEGIKKLSKIAYNKKMKVNVGISTTLSSLNTKEVPDLIKLCKALNIEWGLNILDENLYFFKNVNMSALHIKDAKVIDNMINYIKYTKKKMPGVIGIDDNSLVYCKDYLKNTIKEPPCVLGYLTVYIGSNGEIYSGCWALKPIGNLRKKRLIDILNSTEYKKRAIDMFLRRCPGCTCGFMINVKYQKLLLSILNRFMKYIKIKT